MPYSVSHDIEACPADKPYAVKKQADGKLMGCHPSEAMAKKQMEALYANESNSETRPMERRTTTVGEVHIEKRTDGGQMLVGYGAVFYREGDAGSEYGLAPDLKERIAPTAFDRALSAKQDVRGLFNHDPNMLLGRSTAGTLRLTKDARGLRYEIDLPDTQVGKDVAASVARGDLSGSSFSFSVNGKGGQRFEKGSEFDVRQITDVNLYDVGPVTFPAYESTSTGLRAAGGQDAAEAHEAWLAERQQEQRNRRLRLLELDNQT